MNDLLASSPLNISNKRYEEINYLLPFIDYSNCSGVVDCNITDGLVINYIINKKTLTKAAIYAYNVYIRNFWKTYYTSPKVLYYYTMMFYNTYSTFGEFVPFYKAKEISLETEFDYAFIYLMISCYTDEPLTNMYQITKAKPKHKFSINSAMFMNLQDKISNIYVLPEFDKRVGINNIFFRFIYSNLLNMGIERYYKYYEHFRNSGRHQLLFQSKEKKNFKYWKRIEFMNGDYLYSNYL